MRLQALIPSHWFTPGATPLHMATLAGFASCFLFLQTMMNYIRQQTRIATATDGWLDLIAYDFFGTKLSRSPGQSDASFRRQIIAYLFRHKNTRAAIIAAIENMLGTTPIVVEPQRATDVMCYGVPESGGYGIAGCWGSMMMPLQCFVDVTVPGALSIGPPRVAGYGKSAGGYGSGRMAYIGKPAIDPVTTADIYAALDAVRPVTGILWTRISSA